MNGTLALWYEPTPHAPGADVRHPEHAADAPRPAVELHFNLWRDLESRTNSLDVGFRLKRVDKLRRFYLYVPAPLVEGQLKDLSDVLRFGQTLNAVFNDVVELGSLGDEHYETRVGDEPHLTIHRVEIGSDVRVEPLEREDRRAGALIVFTERLCERIRHRAAERRNDQYLRIRLHLRDASRGLFSQEISTNDGFFVPSGGHLELTEFRLNEKRSYPARVVELAQGRSFHHDGIHYFLIRDLQHQLVEQHAPFRKIRRLEAGLWRHYLVGEAPSQAAAEFERVAARMVIYHWRELAKRNDDGTFESIKDFVAFASFRANRSHLWYYALAVVLLGGMGSAVAAFLSSVLVAVLDRPTAAGTPAAPAPHPDWASFTVFVSLGLLIVALAFIASKVGSRANGPPFEERPGDSRGRSDA